MPASLSVKERKGVVTSFNVDVFVTSALMIFVCLQGGYCTDGHYAGNQMRCYCDLVAAAF